MVNKVILIGNLGRDPEAKQTPNSTLCKFSMATTERRKDQDGSWGEHTEWHNVVCWGKTAENVAKYCQKGKQVYVEGRLQTRKWQDKEGNDRYSTEVVGDRIRFMSDRSQPKQRTEVKSSDDSYLDDIL